MRRALAVIGLLAGAAPARADSSVTVMLNAEGMDVAQRLNVSVDDLIARAKTNIEEIYKTARLDELLAAFADTGAFAQRSIGVDYDVDPRDILVGIAVAGIHGDVAIGTTSDSLLGGSIANITLMTGVNLGRWNHPRWTVFANGFYESTTIRGLSGNLLTLGTHAQVRAIPGITRGAFRWTGLTLTSGLEYAKWNVGKATDTPIESDFTAQGNPGGENPYYSVHMFTNGRLDVTSTSVSIPVEATTGVRLGNMLVLYGGFGLDLTLGSSEIVAQLDSLMTIRADRTPIGTALITASGENGPTTFSAHGLGGIGIHTRRVRVFAQTQIGSGETAVALGTRGAF